MTSWRSADGQFRFIDKQLYRKVNQAGKPMWVHISVTPTWLEEKLMEILQEVLDDETRR